MCNFAARTQPLDFKVTKSAQAREPNLISTVRRINWGHKFPFNNDYIMRSDAEIKENKSKKIWKMINYNNLRKSKKVKGHKNETCRTRIIQLWLQKKFSKRAQLSRSKLFLLVQVSKIIFKKFLANFKLCRVNLKKMWSTEFWYDRRRAVG